MRKAIVILAAIGLALTVGVARAADQGGKIGGGASSLFAAAERGDPRAQTTIGFMHETGRGLPQDYMLAAAWYQRAAQQGYPRAQQLLGLLYDKGQGVAEDYITAHTWLNLAAAGAGRREREYYLRLRNAIGSKLTVAQLTEAQWRARHWRPSLTTP
jgi:TPR repeat protein